MGNGIYIPPGGNIGAGSQTPAGQASLMGVPRTARSASSRRRRAKTPAKTRARRRRRSSGGKFVKGSAAARRHMAKLRKMRKR